MKSLIESNGNDEKTYLFDIDFDHALTLANPLELNPNRRKLLATWEFFLIFLNSEKRFLSLWDWSSCGDWIERMTTLGFNLPNLVLKEESTVSSYFSSGLDWAVARSSSTKTFSTNLEASLFSEMSSDFFLVAKNDYREVPEGHVFKPDFSFSGRGFKFESELIEGYSGVIERWHSRILDFSSCYERGEWKHYFPICSRQGTFRGIYFPREKVHFKNGAFREKILLVQNHLEKLNLGESFQFDSYLYEEAGEIKLRTLCDLNCRKTMAHLFYKIHTPAQPFVFFDYKTLGKNILELSPDTHKRKLFRASLEQAQKSSSLHHLIEGLNQKLARFFD